jgi:hypothetical protein
MKKMGSTSKGKAPQQTTLRGTMADALKTAKFTMQASARPFFEAQARTLVEQSKRELECSACKQPGTLTFSKDKNGHLRVQCSGRDPRCNKSWTAQKFVEWAEIQLDEQLSSASPMASTSAPVIFTQPTTVMTEDEISEAEERQPSHQQSQQQEIDMDDFPPLPSPTPATNKHQRSPTTEMESRPIKSYRIQSLASDSQYQEIELLRETVSMLRQQNSTLQNQLTMVLEEVQALRQLLIQQGKISQQPPQKASSLQGAEASTWANKSASAQKQPLSAHSQPTQSVSQRQVSLPPQQTSASQQQGSVSLSRTSLPFPTQTHPTTLPQPQKKKTYAEAAISLGFAGEQIGIASRAISKLSRRPPQFGHNGSKLVRQYVQGIGRQPIKEIKKLLRDLHFRTSCIPNISFLGTATAEFLVTGNYVSGFQKRITTIGQSCGWKILDNYNAAAAADPQADEATKKRIEGAFLKRVHSIITSTSRMAVKSSYEAWLTSLSLPPPPTPPTTSSTLPVAQSTEMEVEVINNPDQLQSNLNE